jgi:hypothetical protein
VRSSSFTGVRNESPAIIWTTDTQSEKFKVLYDLQVSGSSKMHKALPNLLFIISSIYHYRLYSQHDGKKDNNITGGGA